MIERESIAPLLDNSTLEDEVHALGAEILAELSAPSNTIFNPDYYTERFLSWAMADEEVKVSLFRFVDVLPSLPDSAAVIRHVQEYFHPLKGKLPDLLLKALNLSPDSLAAKVMARTIKKQVRFVAERFIVGESPADALPKLRKMRRRGLAFTVDLVGEASVSEAESEVYLRRYEELLEQLGREVVRWNEAKPIVEGHISEQTPVNISVKLSALYSQARPIATEDSVAVLTERLTQLLLLAKRHNAFVYVDMEDTSLTTITLETFRRALEQPQLRDYPYCGIVLQAYLRRTEEDLAELIRWAGKRSVPIAVRLVKGAYWDTETILALQRGWPIPVFQDKSSSDANYERLSLELLKHHEIITPAFGSHNIRSLCHAIKAAELLGVPPTAFELQTLYGMGDEFKRAFVERGYLVREYAPIGELIPGMGYLVRRLLENTSNEGFLRKSVHEQVEVSELLRKPEYGINDTKGDQRRPAEFVNEPLVDFSFAEARAGLREAIETLRSKSFQEPFLVRPLVGGAPRAQSKVLESVLPEDKKHVLARVHLADQELAEESIRRLAEFFPAWRDTPVSERTAVLRRTAELLIEKRNLVSAAIVLEAGKPWLEADADVAEAIDFLHYYAGEAERLFQPRNLGSFPGENNTYFYEARGVAVVISPWNFPLAIPCGMFSAALVTGNTVVLKPAEQTSFIAQLLFETFLEAGMPPESAAFLPGIGEEIGPHLTEHRLVETIIFTGSREVGLQLVRQGAVATGQHVKRVIAEMGGKNAVIIDDDAELDEAVKGTVVSAFGFQGQKCSACSRVIVVGGNYERVLERIAAAVESLPVGPATDPTSAMSAVIDEEAYRRINDIASRARRDCRLVAEGNIPASVDGKGFYIPPMVFSDIPKNHSILREEIFGPVLAVERADTFEDALALALDSEYGLTGGVFSRSPRNIRRAFEAFRVGNLYINRQCTGALVMRQPFGGARMSGVGSKAGGPDYLHQFVIPRTVTENTIRRGFAPEL